MDPAQAQAGCADWIEKLTRKIQWQSKHVTKNYQILEESQHHKRVKTEEFQEIIELIDMLNRMLKQVKLISTEWFKNILDALKYHKN